MRRSGLRMLKAPWLPRSLTGIWLGVIFLVSASPDPAVPKVGPPDLVPVIGHFAMYAILASLLSWLGLSVRRLERRDYFILIASFVVATAYGAAMEGYQATVPGRYPSWFDVVTNAVGAAFAIAVVQTLRSKLGLRV